ncbi:MAG: metallophosphoesterase [Balneolaceae bacterium]
MITRRDFLSKSLKVSAGALLTGSAGSLFSVNPSDTITILYTNDTHARLDPFPYNARQFAGLGGITRRANVIKKIRQNQPNVLLLDAGDVFQGTPWFDVYGGEVDLELMSKMNYDAMAVGNHEFDHGLEGFSQAAKKADFPILAANYNVAGTPLNDVVRRFITKEIGGYKIGIFGLGIELDGVVNKKLYGDVQHRDPLIWAEGMARSLTQYQRCDFVICLSHIGYNYNDGRICDVDLASKVEGIDLIIGGHTHTFLDRPVAIKNPSGKNTYVTQMGHSGVRLGRIDLDISTGNEVKLSDRFYTIGGE